MLRIVKQQTPVENPAAVGQNTSPKEDGFYLYHKYMQHTDIQNLPFDNQRNLPLLHDQPDYF